MPEFLPPEVAEAFQAHPGLLEACGRPLRAEADPGLSNRVYRVEAGKGVFFLRLPLKTQVAEVDRAAEAHNLKRAADLGLALPPVYCDVENAVLATRAVEVLDPPPADLPLQLGTAIGQLHASAVAFQGHLDPDQVGLAQLRRLPADNALSAEWRPLGDLLSGLRNQPAGADGVMPVPSHGDPSPGNCLAVAGKLWLIDWEFSAMAMPAWDVAYAILEHGFDEAGERLFLEGYRATAAAPFCPAPLQVEMMKTRCDAVSALWAFEQVAAGRERKLFLSFARTRRDRALDRFNKIS